MCPLFHLLLLLICISPFLLICSAASAVVWKAQFTPDTVTVAMGEMETVNFVLSGIPDELQDTQKRSEMQLISTDKDRAYLPTEDFQLVTILRDQTFADSFNISGKFLGSSDVYVRLRKPGEATTIQEAAEKLPVIIIRAKRIIDHVFVGSVAALVSILYINFGAALDLTALKGILTRPIGPTIGVFGQFLLMPLASYVLGLLLFPNAPELALGLFFTGISPGGGASNVWTLVLNGNINLSVAMTAISTFGMFGMMPLWLFTLGKTIFDRAELAVPYMKIATFAIGLIVPLGIGLLIQKYLPRVARVLVRILKPCSTVLILFIIVFAIVTNLYLFQLFSWQIVIAGLALPWIGYAVAYIVARILRQPSADVIAISVETGIQNTGIAIFLLTYCLEQPAADLTVVVPVSVAIMTPFPLLALYIVQKIRNGCGRSKNAEVLITDATDTKNSDSNLTA